jgi:hypothetical protein
MVARASIGSVSGLDVSYWPDSADLGVQQVGRYRGYTGRDANIVAGAALDPLQKSHLLAKRRNLPKFNQGTWP